MRQVNRFQQVRHCVADRTLGRGMFTSLAQACFPIERTERTTGKQKENKKNTFCPDCGDNGDGSFYDGHERPRRYRHRRHEQGGYCVGRQWLDGPHLAGLRYTAHAQHRRRTVETRNRRLRAGNFHNHNVREDRHSQAVDGSGAGMGHNTSWHRRLSHNSQQVWQEKDSSSRPCGL
jgi:hypothetical protein